MNKNFSFDATFLFLGTQFNRNSKRETIKDGKRALGGTGCKCFFASRQGTEMEWPMKMIETERMIGMQMEQVMLRRRRWGKPVLAGAVVIWLVLVILLCSIFFGKRSGEYTTDVTCVSSYHEIYQYFSGLLEKKDRYMLEDGGNLSALMKSSSSTGGVNGSAVRVGRSVENILR